MQTPPRQSTNGADLMNDAVANVIQVPGINTRVRPQRPIVRQEPNRGPVQSPPPDQGHRVIRFALPATNTPGVGRN